MVDPNRDAARRRCRLPRTHDERLRAAIAARRCAPAGDEPRSADAAVDATAALYGEPATEAAATSAADRSSVRTAVVDSKASTRRPGARPPVARPPRAPSPRLRWVVDTVTTALPRNAVILAALLLVGAVMSFLNLRILGHEYGGGPELDAWSAASRLPQLALDILVVGGVVGPFLPLFVGLEGESAERARDFARTILTLAILVMAVAMAVMFVLADQTLSIVAPGFTGVQREDYVGLFRILCVSQVIFAASWVIGEILVAKRRMVAYGLAEPLYYAGIGGGALLLGGQIGIYGAAVGAVGGALAHLGIRLIAVRRAGFRPGLRLSLRTKGLGEFLRLMAPKMLSQPILSLTALYFTFLASTLAPGSVTSFTFAWHFQSLPESLCGVAFATAAFPTLAATFAASDGKAFRRTFATTFATIAGLSIAAALAVALIGPVFIRVYLGGGAFNETDVARTTLVATILAISIPLESLTELFARGLYATRNTILPTFAALAGFAVTVLAATQLSGSLGLAAIPAAYAIGMATKLTVLSVALLPRMARIGTATVGERRVSAGAVAPGLPDRMRPRGLQPRLTGIVMALLLVAVAGGTVMATATVMNHVTLAVNPVVTPWTRVQPSAPPVITAAPATPTQLVYTPATSAAVEPTPTGTPGPFSKDLYKPGDFVGELKDTWCVPAAMQTSMNIMNVFPDTTVDTQGKLFDLAYSIGGGTYGGADPVGWAGALTQLGYGDYSVGAKASMSDAITTVVKQIRKTQRPAGLLVWYGWHAWIVSGFTATADPAATSTFTVLSLRIEDVWYPRRSNLWNKDRDGHSRPPDSDVPVELLPQDYKVWHQARKLADREGLYVFVIPV
jgi:putative peptidoglycan lipid II flippase